MKCFVAVMLIVCASFASAQESKLSTQECAVWARERSFANSVEAHDAKAFAEHVHPGAVFSAATADPQRGREAIVKAWQPIIDGQNVSLRWRPRFVSIGSDPNVAMSRGPFVIASKDSNGVSSFKIGDFVSVWVRKNSKSPWMVLFDGGGPPPAPVSEEEANKHLHSAPDACPRKLT